MDEERFKSLRVHPSSVFRRDIGKNSYAGDSVSNKMRKIMELSNTASPSPYQYGESSLDTPSKGQGVLLPFTIEDTNSRDGPSLPAPTRLGLITSTN